MNDYRNSDSNIDIFEFGSDGYVLGIDTHDASDQKKSRADRTANADSGRLGQNLRRDNIKKTRTKK